MSFSEAFRRGVLWAIGIAFVVGLLTFVISDDEEVWNALVAFFLGFFIVVLFFLLSILSTKCPKCKKYLCFEEYKTEVLSRDVISKKVKDNELGGTKLEHYAVGKRKYYYECSNCGHESTSIKDYKDKIDV